MHPITISFPFRPARRSLATGQVADLFGLADEEPAHVIADGVALDVRPGDLVLITGPSGSGKSSLLRAAGRQLGAVDAIDLQLPDLPLVDALPGSVNERLRLLAACGLSEARLLLRTPGELSDGQRFRFRLAFAFGRSGSRQTSVLAGDGSLATSATRPAGWLLADEFAANLDRTLAKVIAFNLRNLITRTGIGMLLATTHEDLIDDLRPDLLVRCCEGEVSQFRDDRAREPRAISFAGELRLEEGSASDWPRFARWHYRGHRLCFVKCVVLLRHGPESIGICVFTAPAASLGVRTRYFGLHGARSRLALSALNEQLWLLSRVVIHPTYRGAGIAAEFVRRACSSCQVPWIETLTAMGHANPLFERAGFTQVGVVRKEGDGLGYGGQFGPTGKCNDVSRGKSRWSEPVYYVLDNREGMARVCSSLESAGSR
jgi:ABC-type ATPase with predicted acetyltransferase domain